MLREYIWNGLTPVAVIENGAVYFVRVDPIGRPAFATNAAGAVVWAVRYDPFGGVSTQTGVGSPIRFPGQWFQSESGLHQNWMRDYDPTTGRYLQPDPLGLVDGAGVYGYALQNPGRWVDPRGECVGPYVFAMPVCVMAAGKLYDYLVDDCYTFADFVLSVAANASLWKVTRFAARATRANEPTPTTDPDLFEPVRGTSAKRNKKLERFGIRTNYTKAILRSTRTRRTMKKAKGIWMSGMMDDRKDRFDLEERLNSLIKGGKIREIFLHKKTEIVIQFSDGTTLFVNSATRLEFSVTGP